MKKFKIRVRFSDSADVVLDANSASEARRKFDKWFDDPKNQDWLYDRAQGNEGIHLVDVLDPVDVSEVTPTQMYRSTKDQFEKGACNEQRKGL